MRLLHLVALGLSLSFSMGTYAQALDPVLAGLDELGKKGLFDVAQAISELNIEITPQASPERRIQSYLIAAVVSAYSGKEKSAISYLGRAKLLFRQPSFQKKFASSEELKIRQRIEDSIALVEYDIPQILEGNRS